MIASILHLGPPGASIVLGTSPLDATVDAGAVLDAFVEHGGRLIDLGLVYGMGECNESVGRWLRERGTRRDVVLVAKGCHPPHLRPEEVGDEVERSLAQLGVDRLDCFVLHRDDPAVPVAEWGDALLEQVAAGTITTFGVSNWRGPRTLELLAYVEGQGSDRLVVASNQFSLAPMVRAPWPDCIAFDEAERRELPATGLALLAWSSLAAGFLTGSGGEVATRGWQSPDNVERRDRLRRLASALGVDPVTVATAYVAAQPAMLPLVASRTPQHLAAALAADELVLSPAQCAWLEGGGGAPPAAGG
jgi:aryl-alcohol dehydrogenase-like predicted oxidoreductase